MYEAELLILNMYQKPKIAEEILILLKEKEPSILNSSHICFLYPLLEQENFIIVILLTKKGYITELKITWCLESTVHSCGKIILNEITRTGCWVINGNGVVKRLISHSVTHRKLRNSLTIQKVSHFPIERLKEAPPFTYCGLHLFGPFL